MIGDYCQCNRCPCCGKLTPAPFTTAPYQPWPWTYPYPWWGIVPPTDTGQPVFIPSFTTGGTVGASTVTFTTTNTQGNR